MNQLIVLLLEEDIQYLKTFIKEADEELGDLAMFLENRYIDFNKMNQYHPDYDPSYKPEFPDWLIATKELLKNV